MKSFNSFDLLAATKASLIMGVLVIGVLSACGLGEGADWDPLGNEPLVESGSQSLVHEGNVCSGADTSWLGGEASCFGTWKYKEKVCETVKDEECELYRFCRRKVASGVKESSSYLLETSEGEANQVCGEQMVRRFVREIAQRDGVSVDVLDSSYTRSQRLVPSGANDVRHGPLGGGFNFRMVPVCLVEIEFDAYKRERHSECGCQRWAPAVEECHDVVGYTAKGLTRNEAASSLSNRNYHSLSCTTCEYLSSDLSSFDCMYKYINDNPDSENAHEYAKRIKLLYETSIGGVDSRSTGTVRNGVLSRREAALDVYERFVDAVPLCGPVVNIGDTNCSDILAIEWRTSFCARLTGSHVSRNMVEEHYGFCLEMFDEIRYFDQVKSDFGCDLGEYADAAFIIHDRLMDKVLRADYVEDAMNRMVATFEVLINQALCRFNYRHHLIEESILEHAGYGSYGELVQSLNNSDRSDPITRTRLMDWKDLLDRLNYKSARIVDGIFQDVRMVEWGLFGWHSGPEALKEYLIDNDLLDLQHNMQKATDRADQKLLWLSYSDRSAQCGMRGVPLALITTEAMHGLKQRLEEIAVLHDVAGVITGKPSPSQLPLAGELYNAIASFDDTDALTLAVNRIHGGNYGNWNFLFAEVVQNHSIFVQSTLGQLRPHLDGDIVLSQPLSELRGLIELAQSRVDNYRRTGMFTVQHGLQVNMRLHSQGRLDALRGMHRKMNNLQVARNDYSRDIQNTLGRLIENFQYNSALTDFEQQGEALEHELERLYRELGEHRIALEEGRRLPNFEEMLSELQNTVDDGEFVLQELHASLSLAGTDARYIDVLDSIDDASVYDGNSPMEPVSLNPGDILMVSATGAWSPSCALRQTSVVSADGEYSFFPFNKNLDDLIDFFIDKYISREALESEDGGGVRSRLRRVVAWVKRNTVDAVDSQMRRKIDEQFSFLYDYLPELGGVIPDGVAGVSGGLVGPEGYTLTVSHEQFESQDSSTVFNAAINIGVDGRNCIGGDWDAAGFMPVGGIQACATAAAQAGMSYSSSVAKGNTTRSNLSLVSGIRLPTTPFPDAPAGSLLLIEMERGETSMSGFRGIHLVLHSDTPIMVDSEADLYFVVNDRADCSDGNSINTLSINYRTLRPQSEYIEEPLTRLQCAINAMRDEGVNIVERGSLLGNEVSELAGLAWNTIYWGCDGSASDNIDSRHIPQALREIIQLLIQREVTAIERAVLIRNIENELILMNGKVRSFNRRAKLATDSIDINYHLIWRLINDERLSSNDLRIEVFRNAEWFVRYYYPMLRIWYPKVLETAPDSALRAMTDLDLDYNLELVATHMRRLINHVVEEGKDIAMVNAASDGNPLPYELVFLRIPNPDAEPLHQGPNDLYLYSNVLNDSVVQNQFWGAISKRELVELPITAEDIYGDPFWNDDLDVGLPDGRLGCWDALPIVNGISVFVVIDGITPRRDFRIQAMVSERQQIAAADGLHSYLQRNDDALPIRIPIKYINSLEEISIPEESYMTGFSPLSSFSFLFQQLPPNDLWGLEQAHEIVIGMRVEFTQSGQGVKGIQTCP